MSLTVNSGPKALYLYFTQPFNAVDIDDDSTIGTLQVADVSVRDDLQGLKVWVSETSGFTPAAGNLVFDAGFQSIVPLTDLKNNTTYYIKYAFISKIDADEYTTSAQVTATTLDTTLPISGFLNRDPIQIPTDSDGNNAVFTNATGTFVVYNLSTNVTGTAAVTYSVVSGSSVGGVSATIASTGVYTITGITDLVGTITLRAVYTNPQNSSETYSIDLVLNVSKQRPGSTAPIVLLTSTGQAFVKAKNNGTISPSTITFDATIANIAGATYKWYADGVLINGATSSTYTLNSFNNTNSKLIKVRVQSTVVASIDVFDQMSVYYLEEGSDALNAALVNENQTVTLNAAGTVLSGLPVSSQMVVARGSTILTSGVTYSLVSSTNLTNPTINSSTGIISIPTITNLALDIASATFKATVGTAELTKTLSISIVQDGRAAVINIGTVTTSNPGSAATVTNNVTDGGATNTIDISIPRGNTGAPAKGIDILGATSVSFKRSSAGVYTPANSGTLTASPQNLVSPTYNWTVSGGSFSSSSAVTSSSATSVTVYPTDTSSVTVTLQATAESIVYNKTLYYSIVADGVGANGKRTATGVVYKTAYTTDDIVPAAPTATNFTFSTAVFTGGTIGDGTWSKAAPTFLANNTYRYWVASFTAVEGDTDTTTGTGGSLTFGTPTKAVGFSGLVTFSSGTQVTDGTNTIAGFNNQTQIDGGQITTGSILAARIDTRNLTIKDSNGNILFGSGTALDWSNISTSYPSTIDNSSVTATSLGAVKTDLSNAPAEILNSNITATSLGAVKVDLSNAPAGILNSNITAVTIGAVKTDLTNAPAGILNNNLYISKTGAVYSLQGGGTSTSIDAVGLAAVKTDLTNAPSDILNSNVTATSIGAVKTDLSNAPVGILNGQISITETNGVVTLSNAGTGSFTTITSNNKISSTNVATFMQEAAIGEAYIGSISAGKITTGTLDAARIGAGSIDAGKLVIGSTGSGSYMRLFNNKIEVYDGNVLRVKIGLL